MPARQSNATLEYPRLFQGLTTLRYSDAVARAGWYNTTRGSTETTPTGPAEVEESTGGKGGGRTQTKECSQMPLGTEVGCLFWSFCSPKRVPRGLIMFLFRERHKCGGSGPSRTGPENESHRQQHEKMTTIIDFCAPGANLPSI